MDTHDADAEDRFVAESAAAWLCELRSANRAEKAAFVRWLKASPRNVREMLIAMMWDQGLRGIDWSVRERSAPVRPRVVDPFTAPVTPPSPR